MITNLAEIPESVLAALKESGVGGVFEATKHDADVQGQYFASKRHELATIWKKMMPMLDWRITSRIAQEQAQSLRARGQAVILISKWAPNPLATLLHEMGHHFSALSGRKTRMFDYPNAVLARTALKSFRPGHLTNTVEEVIAESIGWMLCGAPLPPKLERLARRIVRESGVSIKLPLINQPSLFDGTVRRLVLRTGMPVDLLRECSQ